MAVPESTDAPAESTRTALAAWAGLAGAFTARAYLAFIVSLGLIATVPLLFGLSAVVIDPRLLQWPSNLPPGRLIGLR